MSSIALMVSCFLATKAMDVYQILPYFPYGHKLSMFGTVGCAQLDSRSGWNLCKCQMFDPQLIGESITV